MGIKEIYNTMRKAIKVSGSHYITDDGWIKSSTTCCTYADDFLNPTNDKFTRSFLTLTFKAEVITKNSQEIHHAKEHLATRVYDGLYGDIIKSLNEICWHVRNGDRAVAQVLVERLYNDLAQQRTEGE